MSRFEFSLATEDDDGQLRQLTTESPMPGGIKLAFAREPSYFGAAAVDGPQVQVVVCRDRLAGRIVGMGSRTIGPRFVNQRATPVGYLGGLRLLPEYRCRAGLLARGYQFFRELHRDGRAGYYLTSIAEDNLDALRLLTSQRAGLPRYAPLGRFVTLAVDPSRAARACDIDREISVRAATVEDRAGILCFLHKHGPERQFFPEYRTSDLFERDGWLRGLRPEDVGLALRDGELCGTLATWDQREFKQTLVCGYAGWLRAGRPLYNILAAYRGLPRLPPAGSALAARYAALAVVAGQKPKVLRSLITWIATGAASASTRLLLFGLHERDPLLPSVRALAGREYVTNLFLVHWPQETVDLEMLAARVPYLELGCL